MKEFAYREYRNEKNPALGPGPYSKETDIIGKTWRLHTGD
jgi:hypothetical protein